MKIVIFSGTTEGRELSARLAGRGDRVTVCVATAYGEEEQGTVPGVTMRAGRMTGEEMIPVLAGADLCVDATHPYAVQATAEIRGACKKAGVEYRRLLRRESALPEGSVCVGTAGEAAAYLAETEGRILLTTGTKELMCFAAIGPERLFPRILPTREGIAACEAAGIPHRNIIAMQGPFSEELNEALLRQYGIACLVTKDGGAPGGFPEKRLAAERTGVRLVVIRRPEETGQTFEEILTLCEKKRETKKKGTL